MGMKQVFILGSFVRNDSYFSRFLLEKDYEDICMS